MSSERNRPGDVGVAGGLEFASDAPRLVVIGRVSTGHRASQTPKNMTEARRAAAPATIEIDVRFRPALVGLDRYSHVIVQAWLDQARRDLVQITRPARPEPVGVFALRSPVRPNPISLSVVRLIAVDVAAGRVSVDALDLIEGTPVIDLKPYRPGVDAVPDAIVP